MGLGKGVPFWVLMCMVSVVHGNGEMGEMRQMGQMKEMGSISQMGQMKETGSISQMGQMKETGSISQMGQMKETGSISQMGQMKETGSISQMGQMEETGSISQMGQMKETGSISQMGQMKETGSISQMGQMKEMGQISQTGQMVETGSISQMGQMKETGSISQMGQMKEMGQISQTGQMEETGSISQMGQMKEMGQISQTGQMEETGSISQTGQMKETGSISQMGQMKETESISQMGQMKETESISQMGQMKEMGQISQTGQMEETGSISQTGQMKETGSISQMGQMKETESISQMGQMKETESISQMGQISQTGQMEEKGDVQVSGEMKETGQMSQKGQVEEMGQMEEKGDVQVSGEMKETGQMSQKGQVEEMGQMEEKGDVQVSGEMKETGQMSQKGQVEEMGQMEEKGEMEEMGQMSNIGQMEQKQTDGGQQSSRIPIVPTVIAVSPAHNGRVCSTWGNYHFKTFDGDIFQLPTTCNYLLVSHCKSNYEDFNIQLRRTVENNQPTLGKVTMKLDGSVIELTKDGVSVNGEMANLPLSQAGILISESSTYIKITSKMGLVFQWNKDDALLLEIDEKYVNQTCGLCGDFNHIQIYDEFIMNGVKIEPQDFGRNWKISGPTETCTEPTPSSNNNCETYRAACEDYLSDNALASCNDLVPINDFVDACIQDMCDCDESDDSSCVCNTISEYSRQCAHAGGQPMNWRRNDFCNKKCPLNLEYIECGVPCADTCSNSDQSALCEDHCIDGCFCPNGTVLDDITQSGCIPLQQCSCTYNNKTFAAGESYSTNCQKCTCSGGQWTCIDLDCPGRCSVEGGSHITSYDGLQFTFHGDCTYILSQNINSDDFVVLGEILKCGLSDSETCLKSVSLIIKGGSKVIIPSGEVLVDSISSQLPFNTPEVTIFRPSTFYIIMETSFRVQVKVQLVPLMQVYLNTDTSLKGQTSGICGNFNNIQGDDFKAEHGALEGTAASFCNSWKTQGSCSDMKDLYDNPCALSIENENYAQHWCSLLSLPTGPFADCHSVVQPDPYQKNCLYDTCSGSDSENSMCASISAYVRICAFKGIQMDGWRDNMCDKYSKNCPSTMTFSYSMTSCNRTCRSISEPDLTCRVDFTSVDGCGCSEGTYMDDSGKCVEQSACPCYLNGVVVKPEEVITKDGASCTCRQGNMNCIGRQPVVQTCNDPMVFLDCSQVKLGTQGSECQKSCQTLNKPCYSTVCVSGCVCPEGLVSDGNGGCVSEDQCPCMHNGASYNPGDTIKVDCNTCTCNNRIWNCTEEQCQGTCAIYGDGHYITFDGKRFNFNGDCEYTLTQDYCSQNEGTFRMITENIPCGTTGTTCSKSIKIFLGNNELKLSDGHFEVLQREPKQEVPYKVRIMGIYLIIEANNGLTLMWDRKTSMFIKLSPSFKGNVCGLCGNYDGDVNNDFTTRSQSVVVSVLEFGNSWKASPSCPDAQDSKDPCTSNPYRQSWAQKQCSIIQSQVFTDCHPQVDPSPFHDACVSDSCACDTGGDCECFCTAVASYAKACNDAGICVVWRSPEICPLFCDYYNAPDGCEWHYKPCGAPCMKTCRNPTEQCSDQITGLEGCYPKCPPNEPIFDEDSMKCVPLEQCGCFDDDDGKHYMNGDIVPTKDNCQTCKCASTTVQCSYDATACYCTYNGNNYPYSSTVYHTTDGIGSCITAVCGVNGTIDREIYSCASTTTPVPSPVPTTVFNFTSPVPSRPPVTSSSTEGPSPTQPIVTSSTQEVPTPAKPFTSTTGTPGTTAASPPVPSSTKEFPGTTQPTLTSSTTESPVPTQPSVSSSTEGVPSSTGPFVTSSTKKVLPTTQPSLTSKSSTATTAAKCTPECKYTSWINSFYPDFGSTGDLETITNIKQKGYDICQSPREIQCRAVELPEVALSEIGQIVTCNLNEGLICKNNDQPDDVKLCYDYEVRFLCCEGCEEETMSTTSSATTKPTPSTQTSAIVSTGEVTKTIQPSLPPSTKEVTTAVKPPVPSSTKEFPGTTQPTLTSSTTESPIQTQPSVSSSTQEVPSSTGPFVTSSTKKVLPTTQPSLTSKSSTATTAAKCTPECKYTSWINSFYPDFGSTGDLETITNIKQKGYDICQSPREIQCRAVELPEVALSEIGQIVTCNLNEGLICKNNDQPDDVKLCYDYEVRFLCCEGCEEETMSTTSSATTKPTPSTQTSAIVSTGEVTKTIQPSLPPSTKEVTTAVKPPVPSSTKEFPGTTQPTLTSSTTESPVPTQPSVSSSTKEVSKTTGPPVTSSSTEVPSPTQPVVTSSTQEVPTPSQPFTPTIGTPGTTAARPPVPSSTKEFPGTTQPSLTSPRTESPVPTQPSVSLSTKEVSSSSGPPVTSSSTEGPSPTQPIVTSSTQEVPTPAKQFTSTTRIPGTTAASPPVPSSTKEFPGTTQPTLTSSTTESPVPTQPSVSSSTEGVSIPTEPSVTSSSTEAPSPTQPIVTSSTQEVPTPSQPFTSTIGSPGTIAARPPVPSSTKEFPGSTQPSLTSPRTESPVPTQPSVSLSTKEVSSSSGPPVTSSSTEGPSPTQPIVTSSTQEVPTPAKQFTSTTRIPGTTAASPPVPSSTKEFPGTTQPTLTSSTTESPVPTQPSVSSSTEGVSIPTEPSVTSSSTEAPSPTQPIVTSSTQEVPTPSQPFTSTIGSPGTTAARPPVPSSTKEFPGSTQPSLTSPRTESPVPTQPSVSLSTKEVSTPSRTTAAIPPVPSSTKEFTGTSQPTLTSSSTVSPVTTQPSVSSSTKGVSIPTGPTVTSSVARQPVTTSASQAPVPTVPTGISSTAKTCFCEVQLYTTPQMQMAGVIQQFANKTVR
ncbi:mucin-5B-like [Erpetoichthys calabaricus]|uniref:mucin-5B-like n=1 Tax=Erpetoichthys calabaricus TaxID=27687 RepID=UPI002234710B|nr:mucin-5B-like [Erpetoichthys calabaricus]